MNDFIVDAMVHFEKREREREKSGVSDSCTISAEMSC